MKIRTIMQTQTVRDRVVAKFTMGAATAINEFNLSEHDMYCLLLAAEKEAGEYDITRKNIEDAAKVLGL
jgi:hypothetical protein